MFSIHIAMLSNQDGRDEVESDHDQIKNKHMKNQSRPINEAAFMIEA
jgi:hypothetical protein